MKIVCSYCDTEFDTEGKSCCPSCGASFSDNALYLKLKKSAEEKREMNLKSDNIELERRRLALEMQKIEAESEKSIKRTTKAMRICCLVPFLIIIAVLTATIIYSIIKGISKNNNTAGNDNVTSSVIEKEKPVAVSFGEEAVTKKYTVVCDKAEEVSRYPFDTTKGYKCVSFHIVVKNTTDAKLKLDNSTVCSVNGYQCEEEWASNQKLLSSNIEAGMKDDGFVWFEIPEDAENVELLYDGLVTVTVNNSDIIPMN